MVKNLARNWGWIVFRGALAMFFAVAALILPGAALGALVICFGAYAFVDGVVALIALFRIPGGEWRHGALILEAIAGILAGTATFLWPGMTLLALVILMGAWAIVSGVFEIIAAISLRKEITGELWLGLAGALSIVFGIAVLAAPIAGALALVWFVAAYAAVFGASLIALGMRLRHWRQPLRSATPYQRPAA